MSASAAVVRVAPNPRVVDSITWRAVGRAKLGAGHWTLRGRIGSVAGVSTARLQVRAGGLVLASVTAGGRVHQAAVRFELAEPCEVAVFVRNSAGVGAAVIAGLAFEPGD